MSQALKKMKANLHKALPFLLVLYFQMYGIYSSAKWQIEYSIYIGRKTHIGICWELVFKRLVTHTVIS